MPASASSRSNFSRSSARSIASRACPGWQSPPGPVPGQIEGGLAAELDDDAHGVFLFDHVEHVLDVQGFEVEPVGDVEIRGNRLRIVVDDHRLISRLPEGVDRVHGGVIEFDPLPDADGARTQDEDGRLSPLDSPRPPVHRWRNSTGWRRQTRLRRYPPSCRRAGCPGPGAASGPPPPWSGTGGRGSVGETHPFRLPQKVGVESPLLRQSAFHLHDSFDLVQEKGIDPVSRCASSPLPPRRNHSASRKRRSSSGTFSRLFSSSSVKCSADSRTRWSAPISRERTAFRRDSSRVRPMAITSPVAFIWLPNLRLAEANLSKGQRGILQYHIIDGRLETGEVWPVTGFFSSSRV